MTIALQVNCETGEVTTRPLTQAELDAGVKAAEESAKAQATATAKREASLAKLAALGLTPEDLAAL